MQQYNRNVTMRKKLKVLKAKGGADASKADFKTPSSSPSFDYEGEAYGTKSMSTYTGGDNQTGNAKVSNVKTNQASSSGSGFKIPVIGWALTKLGGYPVVRNKRTNSVDSVVKIFEKKKSFFLTLAPEGTRAKVQKLKTGFYYIAIKAKVPILLVGFCFKRRVVHFGEKFNPSGDINVDMNKIISFFKNYQGKIPSRGLNHFA